MSRGDAFWTPYRKGVIIAVLSIVHSILFIGWFFALISDPIGIPLWPLYLLLATGIVLGALIRPDSQSRNHPARCGACRKSVFLLWGGESMLGATMTRWWPEKECSECGADLTGDAPF